MRKILFRGKRVDNGNWILGSLIKVKIRNATAWIIFKPDFAFTDSGVASLGHANVDPETVGQYTGLTDKNGKKIFEGDIIEGHCHSAWRHDIQRCEVAYGRDGFEARHYVNCGDERRYFTYRVLFSKDVVVIGNIHDNPELLNPALSEGVTK